MSFRILLIGVVLISAAGYIAVRNSGSVQVFAATVYGIMSKDPAVVFESRTPGEAIRKIKEQHFPGLNGIEEKTDAETAAATVERPGPRDFSKRDRRTGNGFGFGARQPRVPRIGQ